MTDHPASRGAPDRWDARDACCRKRRRDRAWRSFGLGLFAVAIVIGLARQPGTDSSLGLLAFALAILGLVLIVQGKRVSAAVKVECSRHRLLAQAIRDRRPGRPG
jgi:hypothetical protein